MGFVVRVSFRSDLLFMPWSRNLKNPAVEGGGSAYEAQHHGQAEQEQRQDAAGVALVPAPRVHEQLDEGVVDDGHQ